MVIPAQGRPFDYFPEGFWPPEAIMGFARAPSRLKLTEARRSLTSVRAGQQLRDQHAGGRVGYWIYGHLPVWMP